MTRRTATVATILVARCLVSCGAETTLSEEEAKDPVWFEEVAGRVGLDFVHSVDQPRRYWIPETIAGGVALFDKDRDGDLDLYCVQAGALDDDGRSTGAFANALFENDGHGHFRNVTVEAGVGDTGYGIGCTTADYDADGDIDLFVTNLGWNVLYRNRGDGTFDDVSDSLGQKERAWGTSCAFLDVDRDAKLDLFIVNYLDWSADLERGCKTPYGEQDYCGPAHYAAPARDTLLLGDGRGAFSDVSERFGLAAAFGNGLGLVFGDLAGDSGVDVYVANDSSPNQLWRSSRTGALEDTALVDGCALNGSGAAEAGMGVALADLDGNGELDLLCTHMNKETHTFYAAGAGRFRDSTGRSGLALPTRSKTGFGVGAHDFDHDGNLDVFVAGGRVLHIRPEEDPERPFAETDQLFRGLGGGRFEEIPNAGLPAPLTTVGRGAAFGDVDGDGDVDIVVLDADGPLRLYRNVAPKSGRALRLDVRERDGSHALGARVMVHHGGESRLRAVQVAYSYCSSSEPAVHVGLGDWEAVDAAVVTWEDGTRESFRLLGAGEHVLRRGDGRVGGSNESDN